MNFQMVYDLFDNLNLSVTALAAIAVVLTVVLLFAAREAASWFFKIDDLKKDIKKTNQLVVDMEAEVRLLQGLLSQNLKLAGASPLSNEKTEALTASVSLASKKEEVKTRFNLQH